MTLRASPLIALLLIAVFELPVFAAAQTGEADLRAAIWASILADPRSADIPPAEMQVLVEALAAEAESKDLTAQDILWRPQSEVTAASAPESEPCGRGFAGYLCSVNENFGFAGDDLILPALLFASSGLLIVVIRRMRLNAQATTVVAEPLETPSPFDEYL